MISETTSLEKEIKPGGSSRPPGIFQDCTELASLASRDTLRAAVRLCRTPFLAALSILDWASVKLEAMASLLFSAAVCLKSLVTDFTRVLTALFLKRRSSLWRARLSADL
jgi:hypothetical protein